MIALEIHKEFSSENQVVFSQYIFINNLPGGVENVIVQAGSGI